MFYKSLVEDIVRRGLKTEIGRRTSESCFLVNSNSGFVDIMTLVNWSTWCDPYQFKVNSHDWALQNIWYPFFRANATSCVTHNTQKMWFFKSVMRVNSVMHPVTHTIYAYKLRIIIHTDVTRSSITRNGVYYYAHIITKYKTPCRRQLMHTRMVNKSTGGDPQ